MSTAYLIRGARQLLTLRGSSGPRRGAAMNDLSIIPDGALLVVDGRIMEVGPSRRVEMLQASRDAVEIDATGKVVLPGFVDCYTHLVCPPVRFGMAAAPPEDEHSARLPEPVKLMRASTGQRMEFEARRRLRNFVREGTTTLEARSGHGLDDATELKTLRVLTTLHDRPLSIVPSFYGARALPPEFEGRPSSYLDWLAEHMLPLVKRRRLAQFVNVHCGPEGFPAESARLFIDRVRGLGFPVRVEASPAAPDGAVDVACSAGAHGLDGLTACTDFEARALAASPIVVTLLPGRSFHLGSPKYPPARALVDAGAAVALASGFDSETSPTCSIPLILSLATNFMKLTPAEALTACTINAAWAVGLGSEVGSLELGKWADLLMINAGDYREIPYHFGMDLLAWTMRHGETLYPRMESRE